MNWLLVIGLTWALLAVPAALIFGRVLQAADADGAWTDAVEQFLREQPGARTSG